MNLALPRTYGYPFGQIWPVKVCGQLIKDKDDDDDEDTSSDLHFEGKLVAIAVRRVSPSYIPVFSKMSSYD